MFALLSAMRTCCMTGPDNKVFWTLLNALAWGQTRDPPDSFQDVLRTLHELCSSGRVHAIGRRLTGQPRNAFIRIPASDWVELYFDSDGEQLRSEDVFSRILYRRRAWTSVRFSQADLVREWPNAGVAGFVKEHDDKYWGDRFRARGERTIRERSRQKWIDRFAAKQQEVRRWISFVEIADVCARAASPVSIAAEEEARALAYRRLVESMARGEFERNGRSWVLLLFPNLVASVPPHRLTREYFRAMVDAYGVADFTNDSGLVRDNLWFCWLSFDLCREWFARHLLEWPDEFTPKDQTLDARPRSGENNPNLEISGPLHRVFWYQKRGSAGGKLGPGVLMTTPPCKRCCNSSQATRRCLSMRPRTMSLAPASRK